MTTRARRAPINDSYHRGSRRLRLYCPCCGESRGGESIWSNASSEHNGRDLVYPHERRVFGPCPGGPVDPVKDRAP